VIGVASSTHRGPDGAFELVLIALARGARAGVATGRELNAVAPGTARRTVRLAAEAVPTILSDVDSDAHGRLLHGHYVGLAPFPSAWPADSHCRWPPQISPRLNRVRHEERASLQAKRSAILIPCEWNEDTTAAGLATEIEHAGTLNARARGPAVEWPGTSDEAYIRLTTQHMVELLAVARRARRSDTVMNGVKSRTSAS
jgi:hypothetical protein